MTEIGEDLIYTFANLMYVGFTPEEIKHKMSLSSEMLEELHLVYFNKGQKE